ncbi:MAG: PEP-CTERM-box response regulator transcription factor [Pseudomonadales bacterium]|nr:PEP-CTERM-box response regulator transcription factor [Pseudomonadales bacterium]
MKNLLIIEDDEGLRSQLKWCFDDLHCALAYDEETAIQAIKHQQIQVVLLDLGLPPDAGGSTVGFHLLEQILQAQPECQIIIMTGLEDRDNALKAIEKGAFDFLPKPLDDTQLQQIVARAFHRAEIECELKLKKNTAIIQEDDGIIGISPSIMALKNQISKAAHSDISCLILGATGTGKELVAQALHQQSPRKNQAFVAINCAAIPDTLLESELFGYEKGAFTGANKSKVGRIAQADKGTLFLDEIGDMPLALQCKLLRILQERTIEPLGSTKSTPIDIRVICATHQNLQDAVDEKRFREDLYYRIAEFTLKIATLKDRHEDIEILANHYLQKFSRAMTHKKKLLLSDASLKALQVYPWPGNIRELISKLKRAVALASGNMISPEDLDLPQTTTSEEDKSNIYTNVNFSLRAIKTNAETQAIERALTLSNYNMSKTSKLLGITRPTLYNLIEKYDIYVQH